MTTVVMMRNKAKEMKSLVEEGLHAFGKVMTMCQDMCEESEMGERGYYGHRDYDYPYGDRMGMRDYPQYPYDPYMGERQGVRGTGRYGMYR
ncbi:MAG: hypothetical protein KBT34_10715 [Prevotella sp.]|nr:hypothetical protein [Candidatus Prevotella equi]